MKKSLVLFAYRDSEQVSNSWDSYNRWRILKLCTHDIVRGQLNRALRMGAEIYIADEKGLQCKVEIHKMEGRLDSWKVIFKNQVKIANNILVESEPKASWPHCSFAWVEQKNEQPLKKVVG